MHNEPREIELPHLCNEMGSLAFFESTNDLGFDIKRVYYLYDVPEGKSRGFHAHKELWQCFVALHGSVDIEFESDGKQYHYHLNSRHKAVILPPGYWRVLKNFSNDCVFGVFASEDYSEDDYIRDYDAFKAWEKNKKIIKQVDFNCFKRLYADLKLDLDSAYQNVMSSGYYIRGKHHESFEKQFAEYCGTKYAIGVGNGLDSIVLTMQAWGLGPGDEVILAANSFVATAIGVAKVGATPVLVDMDSKTYNIDVTQIEAAITPRTKAIALTHLYGQAADMDAIKSLACQHQLKVFEDSAQAHGATYNGERCGGLGDAAGFSFYPTKNMGAFGDAGIITTNDKALAEKIRMLGNYGAASKYEHAILGVNSRLDELQAAFLSVKLKKIEHWNAIRRQWVKLYYSQLSDIKELELPYVPEWADPVWHVFAVRVLDGQREQLINWFKDQNIGYNIHYPKPIHLHSCFSELGHTTGSFPKAESASQELLSLPLDPYHTEDEIRFVAKQIRHFFSMVNEQVACA